ncbi:MAG: J domain-containing protein [Firmicutes bacterium]|nr:J domain-containing protein [Dethiobacter sp.]MBS3889387.1 J domain-containing protein [Bacillota bacterium]MBS4054810.1 J domain-containing protein [Thermaerobacter sp.]
MTDPRLVLGVGPQADVKEIRQVYRRLVKLHHPDVGGHPEHFKEITAAYLRLSARATHPALAGVCDHRVRVVYGRGTGGQPFYIMLRKLLSHKVVWHSARIRLALPLAWALTIPTVVWFINPYAVMIMGAIVLLGGRTSYRKF